jgi:hypothetical protein
MNRLRAGLAALPIHGLARPDAAPATDKPSMLTGTPHCAGGYSPRKDRASGSGPAESQDCGGAGGWIKAPVR